MVDNNETTSMVNYGKASRNYSIHRVYDDYNHDYHMYAWKSFLDTMNRYE